MDRIAPTRPTMPDYEEYISEIKDIWETGLCTNNGPKLKKLKQLMLERIGCKNADLFVNGHSTLLIALNALGIKGEVITSPFTFTSTTNALVQSGCTPVFCDIDDTYNIDATKIEQLITEKTTAIVTPHIFGIPCNVMEIGRIAKKYNLKVIYDGAQAFGTRIEGKDIGVFGDATMFSLHAIKVFHSIEGGLLTYADETLTDKLQMLRNFGLSYGEDGSTDVECIGINAKMDEFRAAMGIVNLRGIDEEIQKRKKLAGQYCYMLADIPGITTYEYSSDIDYNYAYFPIKVHKEFGISRDELWRRLSEKGIGTRKLYDKLTCDYSCYKDRGYRKDTPNADHVKGICLDLPMYGTLKSSDVERVCEAIKKERG